MIADDEISMEQLYKMLHVSKRKAVWMLQNGIIPCRVRNTSTHKYAIRFSDVEAYLAKSSREREDEIPTGLFNSRKNPKTELIELCLTLNEDETAEYVAFLRNALRTAQEQFTVIELAEFTGYTEDKIESLIWTDALCAVKLYGRYCIPKESLIDFLTTNKAFGIKHKSSWHKRLIRRFMKTQGEFILMKEYQVKMFREIGQRIRIARQEAQIGQEELGKAAGIACSYISDIEAGRRNFSVDVLIRISDTLQVSTDWILKGKAPSVGSVPDRSVDRLLDGLTADDVKDIMMILTDIKRSIKRVKCAVMRNSEE